MARSTVDDSSLNIMFTQLFRYVLFQLHFTQFKKTLQIDEWRSTLITSPSSWLKMRWAAYCNRLDTNNLIEYQTMVQSEDEAKVTIERSSNSVSTWRFKNKNHRMDQLHTIRRRCFQYWVSIHSTKSSVLLSHIKYDIPICEQIFL